MDKKLEQLQENVAYTWAAYDAAYAVANAADVSWDALIKSKRELANYLQGKDV